MERSSPENQAMTMHGSAQVRRRDVRQGVNLFDLPELMRGAQPGSNVTNRRAFKARSVKVYQDAASEDGQNGAGHPACVRPPLDVSDAVAMFPFLDADLVKSICSDARTTDTAMATLLALSQSIAEPVSADASSGSPRDIGVDDHDLFPSLVDADGWQIANIKDLACHDHGDRGRVWCDRARAAASQPAPPIKPGMLATPNHRRHTQAQKSTVEDVDDEASQDNEYEWRRKAGVKRMENRRQYPRPHRANTSVTDMQEV